MNANARPTEPTTPGYIIGQRALSAWFQWQFWAQIPDDASNEAVATFTADVIAGARAAIADAYQASWREDADSARQFAGNLRDLFGMARGSTARHVTRNRSLLVDILIGATEAGLADDAFLQALRDRAINQIHLALLLQSFCPDTAQRTGFGTRYIETTNPFDGGAWAWWEHPTQVDAGLNSSDFAYKDLAEVIPYATTAAAMTRVLDVWHAGNAPRRPDAPLSPLDEQTLPLVVQGRTRYLAPGDISGAVDALRLLRDHPRTAPTFWADVLASSSPDESTLLAFEALAAETAGPGATSALEQLADARVAHWVVPEAIAARVRTRLRAAAITGEELEQP